MARLSKANKKLLAEFQRAERQEEEHREWADLGELTRKAAAYDRLVAWLDRTEALASVAGNATPMEFVAAVRSLLEGK